MAKPRQKWRVTYGYGSGATTSNFPSQNKADAAVRDLAAQFAAGGLDSTVKVARIYVNEGDPDRWQLFDVCDLAEWSATAEAMKASE